MLNLQNQNQLYQKENLKYSYMNKRQKQHKSIVSGNANAVAVVNKDLNYALRTFKRKIKDSNVLEKLKENKTFIKPSVKRRQQINKAKYIQHIKDLQQLF
tara:strand:+ start:405 stop:704 length:300 start_codon:yes stop_codon:yes gene_type:complete